MYAKITGNVVQQFPYTIGDLRKDNANVSFPKNITATILEKYNVYSVSEGTRPNPTAYQVIRRNDLPKQIVLGKDAEGNDILSPLWRIDYTAVDMFSDTTETDEDGNETTTTKAEHEAAYQIKLNNEAASINRNNRNALLAGTDWTAGSDVTMTSEMTTYRQALRDITAHENWPNLQTADWPEKV